MGVRVSQVHVCLLSVYVSIACGQNIPDQRSKVRLPEDATQEVPYVCQALYTMIKAATNVRMIPPGGT